MNRSTLYIILALISVSYGYRIRRSKIFDDYPPRRSYEDDLISSRDMLGALQEVHSTAKEGIDTIASVLKRSLSEVATAGARAIQEGMKNIESAIEVGREQIISATAKGEKIIADGAQTLRTVGQEGLIKTAKGLQDVIITGARSLDNIAKTGSNAVIMGVEQVRSALRENSELALKAGQESIIRAVEGIENVVLTGTRKADIIAKEGASAAVEGVERVSRAIKEGGERIMEAIATGVKIILDGTHELSTVGRDSILKTLEGVERVVTASAKSLENITALGADAIAEGAGKVRNILNSDMGITYNGQRRELASNLVKRESKLNPQLLRLYKLGGQPNIFLEGINTLASEFVGGLGEMSRGSVTKPNLPRERAKIVTKAASERGKTFDHHVRGKDKMIDETVGAINNNPVSEKRQTVAEPVKGRVDKILKDVNMPDNEISNSVENVGVPVSYKKAKSP